MLTDRQSRVPGRRARQAKAGRVMVRDVWVRVRGGRRTRLLVVFAALCAIVVPACGKSSGAGSAHPAAPTTQPKEPPAPPAPYDRANFDATSIDVTNRYLPLTPGREYTYQGTTLEDDKSVPHRETFTVTDLVKRVDGVDTVVIADKDFGPGGLEESELTFFAQDKAGTVWHFGQYREAYDGKELVGGQAWLAGHLAGARPGIFMLVNPTPTAPSYSEGYAPPPFYWDDDAKIRRTGEHVSVSAGRYDDVLVVAEYNAEEPGEQLKYYAPGVGFVKVGWEGKDTQHETLELASMRQLTGEELTAARTDALALETRAAMYGTTPPAQVRPTTSS
jgi:hypothetical protein